jgi:polar amino acid transport system substrate-binding protein
MTRLPTWIALLLALAGGTSHAQTVKAVTEHSSLAYVQDGKVAGPTTAVVETTLRHAGLTDHRVNLYPWARAYDTALQEPNVLIYPLARTLEREQLFKWVGEVLRVEYHFYKLRERKDIAVRDLQDVKNYTVGVVRDDVRHRYLQAQGFTKMVVSAQNLDNLRMLLNRQVQLTPLSERDALLLSETARVDFASLEKVLTLDSLSTGLYLAYSLATDDEIVARTRTAFDRLKAEGTITRLMSGKR